MFLFGVAHHRVMYLGIWCVAPSKTIPLDDVIYFHVPATGSGWQEARHVHVHVRELCAELRTGERVVMGWGHGSNDDSGYLAGCRADARRMNAFLGLSAPAGSAGEDHDSGMGGVAEEGRAAVQMMELMAASQRQGAQERRQQPVVLASVVPNPQCRAEAAHAVVAAVAVAAPTSSARMAAPAVVVPSASAPPMLPMGAPVALAAAAAPMATSIVAQLRELAELKGAGALTEEEYSSAKKQVLAANKTGA
jgi:hypothetical protein